VICRATFVVLLLSACSVDLSVPATALVQCATSADCPSSTICKQSLGMCVNSVGDDGRAPAVTNVALTPSIVTIGGTLTLTITVDEVLGRAPEVTLGSAGHFQVAASEPSTMTYTLTYEIRGTELPGDEPVNVDVVDVFGNEAQTVAATATLDFVAPRLTSSLWVLPPSQRAVKPGDTATLVANVDIGTTLSGATLFIDSASVADVSTAFTVNADTESGGLQLRGEIAIPASGLQNDSVVAVGFALSDIAGNVTNPQAALSPALPVDSTPPLGGIALTAPFNKTNLTATLTTDNAIRVTLSGDIDSPTSAQAPVPASLTVIMHGNGMHTVTAVFEDDAGNQTTAMATCDLEVPPGHGDPGAGCATNEECSSTVCACATSDCTTRRCAASQTCAPCHYVDGSGVCTGNVNTQTTDPLRCAGNNVCGPGGVCDIARGNPCTQSAQCITGHCSCKDANCTGLICTDFDCGSCNAGLTCSTHRTNDTVCDSGKVCRVGSCVVRDPGTCTAACTGTLTCGAPSITNHCTSEQGFGPSFTGSCPASGPCQPGQPDCACF
jgi:hypothetical protein